ncbi:Uncharacterized protein M6B38_229090 [Iris pallida]|uniref:Uncharacterized protein n=1 Tax=Iris pallida TaxID=29817 RepID=A0AAX6DTA5_IRIPA|nr:Uncharacterized protein M6B38_229090 [Iris pallida]
MVVSFWVGIPTDSVFTSLHHRHPLCSKRTTTQTSCSFAPALLAAAVIFSSAVVDSPETLSNIPQNLSGEGGKQARIQRPKSRKAESCTSKCVATCTRGGDGEGPLNVRRPIVVFKQGFRSRQYCLVECSDICNLIKDGDDGF